MGDHTRELRDLFESVTGTETVTERQQEGKGTLAETGGGDAALEAAIDSMREKRSFETALPTAALATIVERFYEGDSDAAIAETIEAGDGPIDPSTVAAARLDLHLVRDADRPPAEFRSALEAIESGTTSIDSVAARLDTSAAQVKQYLAVRETQAERRQVADRYRQQFESLVADGDLGERLTASLEATGLDEAVADQEVDVDL